MPEDMPTVSALSLRFQLVSKISIHHPWVVCTTTCLEKKLSNQMRTISSTALPFSNTSIKSLTYITVSFILSKYLPIVIFDDESWLIGLIEQ